MIINKSKQSELSEPLIEEIKRMQFTPEAGHLPLANSPERFLDMMKLLNKSEKKEMRVSELSKLIGITERQIYFYSETGDRTFGLFDRSNKGIVKLTSIGESVSHLTLLKQIAYLQNKLLRLPFFREIKQSINHISTIEVVALLVKNQDFRKNFSDSSLKRRAGTLLSWAKWLNAYHIAMDDNELSDYIKQNKNLIYEVVHRLKINIGQQEDYFSVATIGLQKAFLNYNEERENRFSTYAFTCMQNEILSYMRHEKKWGKTILIGMNERDNNYSYEHETGLDVKSSFTKEETWTSNEPSVEEQCITRSNVGKMMEAVNKLPERERSILKSFYFKNMNQTELAVKFNMSQANISKIIIKTLKQLHITLFEAVA